MPQCRLKLSVLARISVAEWSSFANASLLIQLHCKRKDRKNSKAWGCAPLETKNKINASLNFNHSLPPAGRQFFITEIKAYSRIERFGLVSGWGLKRLFLIKALKENARR